MSDDETRPASPPDADTDREGVASHAAPASRRTAAHVALLLGIVGMLAAGLFFAFRFSSVEGGATTPVAAVERLVESLGNEDAIGVLETLLPSERALLRGRIEEVSGELSRLGILDDALDLTDLAGLELEFFGVRLDVEELAPGISAVRIREGRVRSGFDPHGGILGDFVRRLLPRQRAVERATWDLGDGDVVLATVREGDQWYVSLWYSFAENARRDAGAAVPGFGREGTLSGGADSPEAAVGELIHAASLLDVGSLIRLMPPEEARALHDYANFFVHQVAAPTSHAKSFFQAQITDLDLSTRMEGETAVVKVEKLAFRYGIPELGLSIEYDGECAVYRFEGEPPEMDCGTGIGPTLPLFLPFEELPQPDVGFVVVREGGEWYVSPTRTLLDAVIGYLKAMKPEHLDAIKEYFEYGPMEEVPDLLPEPTPKA